MTPWQLCIIALSVTAVCGAVVAVLALIQKETL